MQPKESGQHENVDCTSFRRVRDKKKDIADLSSTFKGKYTMTFFNCVGTINTQCVLNVNHSSVAFVLFSICKLWLCTLHDPEREECTELQ